MAIQIGVVGCGSIGTRRHIPEIAANKDAKLVAVCDINEKRAHDTSTKFTAGEAKAYAAFDAFLKHPGMDLVVVATPNYLHAPQTIASLKAGKHVLVEKPMATTRDEARAMLAAADASKRQLMVGQNQRLERAHQKAREILASGRLGKVLTFRTAFKHRGPDSWSVDSGPGTWFFKKKEAVLGVCGDLGIHKADLMRYLLADEITEVSAIITTQDKRYADGSLIDVDDNAMLLVRTRSGATGSIIISWTNYGESEANYTHIYCQKGVMSLATDPQWGVIVRYADGTEERHKTGIASTNERQVFSGVSSLFIESIKTGSKPPIDGLEGYKSLDVILAAFESSDSGQRIKLGA